MQQKDIFFLGVNEIACCAVHAILEYALIIVAKSLLSLVKQEFTRAMIEIGYLQSVAHARRIQVLPPLGLWILNEARRRVELVYGMKTQLL